MKKSAHGFTLIELLVVVAIIAILSVIGITVFSGVQRNARDARRRADIDAISTAMEANYNSTAGTYAALSAGFFAGNTIPTDPGTYTYLVTVPTGSKSFTACVPLEAGGNYCKNSQQ